MIEGLVLGGAMGERVSPSILLGILVDVPRRTTDDAKVQTHCLRNNKQGDHVGWQGMDITQRPGRLGTVFPSRPRDNGPGASGMLQTSRTIWLCKSRRDEPRWFLGHQGKMVVNHWIKNSAKDKDRGRLEGDRLEAVMDSPRLKSKRILDRSKSVKETRKNGSSSCSKSY